MRIRFLEDREVKDHNGLVVESFRAGEVVELSTTSARRWLKRNAAQQVADDAPIGPKEVPAPDPPLSVRTGESRDSGPEQQRYASPPAPVSPPSMSSESDEPTPQGDAGSSRSTAGSGPKEDASSTLHLPTSSTPRTQRGGRRRKTRQDSKGSR